MQILLFGFGYATKIQGTNCPLKIGGGLLLQQFFYWYFGLARLCCALWSVEFRLSVNHRVRDTATVNTDIFKLCVRPVSYTHLTLPTNREV